MYTRIIGFAVIVNLAANVIGSPGGRVLLIGIDGCRFDAVEYSQATTLKRLYRSGAYSDQTDVLGDRPTGAATITGPGWCSALTGTWADKHRVLDNAFRGQNLARYPTFLRRVKQSRPSAHVVALVSWKPFQEFVFSKQEGCRLVADGDTVGYAEADRQVTAAAIQVLQDEDPTVLFVYFGEVDITGHGYGFHPRSPKYTNAIEVVDKQVGSILSALQSRPCWMQEDWLVMVCTDHGGQGRDHSLGRDVPEIRNGFLILHGPSVQQGPIPDRTYNVDVAATALAHLRVRICPEWGLDGKAMSALARNRCGSPCERVPAHE